MPCHLLFFFDGSLSWQCLAPSDPLIFSSRIGFWLPCLITRDFPKLKICSSAWCGPIPDYSGAASGLEGGHDGVGMGTLHFQSLPGGTQAKSPMGKSSWTGCGRLVSFRIIRGLLVFLSAHLRQFDPLRNEHMRSVISLKWLHSGFSKRIRVSTFVPQNVTGQIMGNHFYSRWGCLSWVFGLGELTIQTFASGSFRSSTVLKATALSNAAYICLPISSCHHLSTWKSP